MTSPENEESIPSCGTPHQLLCLECGAERVWDHGLEGRICECGNAGIPASLNHMLDIHISRDELRILTFNASDYAIALQKAGYDPEGYQAKAVQVIVDRLALYTDTALTASQIVANMRSMGMEAHILRNGEVTDE